LTAVSSPHSTTAHSLRARASASGQVFSNGLERINREVTGDMDITSLGCPEAFLFVGAGQSEHVQALSFIRRPCLRAKTAQIGLGAAKTAMPIPNIANATSAACGPILRGLWQAGKEEGLFGLFPLLPRTKSMFKKRRFSAHSSKASPGYFLVCSSVKIPIEFSISKKRMKTNGSSARCWQDGSRPPVHEDTPSHTPPPHPGVSAAMVDGGSVSGRVCNGCTFLFSGQYSCEKAGKKENPMTLTETTFLGNQGEGGAA
jgi:hypothetical protein